MPIKRKIRNIKGESLGEVLIALLISTFAIMLLAGMIGSATNIISRSRDSMTQYYENSRLLTEYDSRASLGPGTIKIKMGDKELTSENVEFYQNTNGNIDVISYKVAES